MGQTSYPSKSWVIKCCFSFKVWQHGQQQLCLQYKVCWILCKRLAAFFLFTTLLLYTTTHAISNKNPFLYFSQFSPQNHPCNPTNNFLPPYLSNFAPLNFSVQPSEQPTPKIFPYSAIELIQAASRDHETRMSCENWYCFNLSNSCSKYGQWKQGSQLLTPYCSVSENWCIAGRSPWQRCLQFEWQTIQSTFSHILNLFSLLRYPTNTTTRTNILLETSYTTWFLYRVLDSVYYSLLILSLSTHIFGNSHLLA